MLYFAVCMHVSVYNIFYYTGVLYFAGHGFETHKGNSFLVPSDSPIDTAVSSCISVTSVINRILEKNPALCLVVLDICRVRYNYHYNMKSVTNLFGLQAYYGALAIWKQTKSGNLLYQMAFKAQLLERT